ncbi:hypothetical protein ACP275_04G236100 [Erythranthe tilingii]
MVQEDDYNYCHHPRVSEQRCSRATAVLTMARADRAIPAATDRLRQIGLSLMVWIIRIEMVTEGLMMRSWLTRGHTFLLFYLFLWFLHSGHCNLLSLGVYFASLLDFAFIFELVI